MHLANFFLYSTIKSMISSKYFCQTILRTCGFCKRVFVQRYSSRCLIQSRHLYVSSSKNAGHSHWENIRHIKSAKDQARAKVFFGLSRRIAAIIKAGGNDPKKNVELSKVLGLCRTQNMPQATIDRCLQEKQYTDEFVYGIGGPGGCAIVITCQAVQPKVSKQAITRAINISTLDANFEQQRMNEFTRKRVILADLGDREMDEDEATEIALEIGAEDVKMFDKTDGNILEFTCNIQGYGDVETALQKENLAIISSKLEYIPNMTVDLSESDSTMVEIFIAALQKISDKPEILFTLTDIHHNVSSMS